MKTIMTKLTPGHTALKWWSNSRSLTWACALMLAATAPIPARANGDGDTVITTSQSTLTLPSIGGLTSENGLRQAGRIAEIALGEGMADAAALKAEEDAFTSDVATYKQDDLNTRQSLDAVAADYMADVTVHNAEAAQQVAFAQASNSLPPEQRNPETVRRGNEWAAKIGRQAAALEERRQAYATERSREIARVTAIYDALALRQYNLKASLGLAYRQLKVCADYAAEINRKLAESYRADGRYFTPGEALVGAQEELKVLSGRGWDPP